MKKNKPKNTDTPNHAQNPGPANKSFGGPGGFFKSPLADGVKVYIYGTGSAGRSLWMYLRKCRVDVKVIGFIDTYKSGEISGKRIFRYNAFKEYIQPDTYDIILVASGANREIATELEKEGLPFQIVSVPSYLMENLLPVTFGELLSAAFIKLSALFFRRRIHLFFGEHGGKFIGNNKYYYLYVRNKLDEPVYWVVDDPVLYETLKAEGIDVADFNEPGFRRLLYRAAYFYFDNMTWQRKYPWLRHFRAKNIHMSHGVGLKVTEKMLIPKEFLAELTKKETATMESKIFQNHLLVSTSDFYARNVSAPAYGTPMERITLSGYPKNDLFYRTIKGSAIFTDNDTLPKVKDFKERGGKVIVYAPTFRDMDKHFKPAEMIDYHVFDGFLREHRLLFVVKGHTSTSGGGEVGGGAAGYSSIFSNILEYNNQRDGYPLLKEADLLITDYSSIYMDFLHMGKPVLFFIYDYQEYIDTHREIQFDYHQMTPGPKALTSDQLTHWIERFLVSGEDEYRERRDEILALAFKHRDGQSSKRLYQTIKKM